MPTRALRPCSHRLCPNLVKVGERYCDIHKSLHKHDYARKNPELQKLYNSNRWRRYRIMYLAAHPLCVNFDICGNAATIVHHIKDHEGNYELFWDPENHIPMCSECHNRHTAQTKGWGKK